MQTPKYSAHLCTRDLLTQDSNRHFFIFNDDSNQIIIFPALIKTNTRKNSRKKQKRRQRIFRKGRSGRIFGGNAARRAPEQNNDIFSRPMAQGKAPQAQANQERVFRLFAPICAIRDKAVL